MWSHDTYTTSENDSALHDAESDVYKDLCPAQTVCDVSQIGRQSRNQTIIPHTCQN